MPTTPHPDDPAEGSRETIDRELKRTEGREHESPAAEETGEPQKKRPDKNEEAAGASRRKP